MRSSDLDGAAFECAPEGLGLALEVVRVEVLDSEPGVRYHLRDVSGEVAPAGDTFVDRVEATLPTRHLRVRRAAELDAVERAAFLHATARLREGDSHIADRAD